MKTLKNRGRLQQSFYEKQKSVTQKNILKLIESIFFSIATAFKQWAKKIILNGL